MCVCLCVSIWTRLDIFRHAEEKCLDTFGSMQMFSKLLRWLCRYQCQMAVSISTPLAVSSQGQLDQLDEFVADVRAPPAQCTHIDFGIR